jgi:hypothetical protein
MYFLYLLQLLNIIIALFSIVIGLRSFRTLKENRVLLLIPVLSLLQIILTESMRLVRKIAFSTFTSNLISLYIYSEFILIILYFWSLNKNLTQKAFTIALIPIVIISLIITQYYVDHNKLIKLDIFVIIEGPIILTIALLFIIEIIKKRKIKNYSKDSNLIATFGIFFSFIISWPTMIIQNNILKYLSPFIKLCFIYNTIAYLIFFSFLSYSFYVTRKFRII